MKEPATSKARLQSVALEMTLPATLRSVAQFIEFIKRNLEEIGCPSKVSTKLAVIVDEIASNIVKYAYGSSTGDMTVQLVVESDEPAVQIAFIDEGVTFDPLEAFQIDSAKAIESRRIGGQGILITKAFADEVEYERQDNKNILRIRKRIGC